MTSKRLRIGVVFGGRSGEHEVSLASARSVIAGFDPTKYDVVPIGITPDGRWWSGSDVLTALLKRSSSGGQPIVPRPEPGRGWMVGSAASQQEGVRLDVVFPLVHGTYGEDGCLQGLLELADVPYVGSGVLASAAGMDKIIQKQLFRQAGLLTPRAIWCSSEEWRATPARIIRRVEQALRYPVFVKPANTGSSVGITKAHARSELRAGIETAVAFDHRIIIEQGIRNARELECSILGNEHAESSVAGEIISSNEFYDYDAKYVDGQSRALIPAPLSPGVARRVRELALAAYAALDCAGMARVDLFLTRKGSTIYLNELNTIPGFTSISMYPKLWEASGLSFPDLLDRLVELAIERHKKRRMLRRAYHPSRDWFTP